MNIYRQIKEDIDIADLNLSQTELRIMFYIKNEIDNIKNIGVREIAEHCYCSTASIHRFVGKFGCSGFKEFKAEIIAKQNLEATNISDFGKQLHEMTNYVEHVDTSKFTENIKRLDGSRVSIYGMGGSYITAEYLERMLADINVDATAYTPYERAGMTDLSDAVLFVSNTGDTNIIIDLANSFKMRGVPVYAITKKDSPLSKVANYSLVHNNIFNRDIHVERESQLAIMMLIEKVFHELR